jgi:hypothetical protein
MKSVSNLKLQLIAALCLGVIMVPGLFGDPAGPPVAQATRRFGLFIGSNNGGRDRIMLRYAVSDARAVSRVFGDMGGIAGEDNVLVMEPNLRELNRQITNLAARIEAAKRDYRRTELVFYYSGHSDEDGLLLGRERYQYADLRRNINQIPSDMRIVILDSCSSGSFTRAKGGTKTQPFLIDSSLSAEGYAFLTSSSATEASQESDAIESSYFTHSLVAGLRGAADTVGDRRVTLNEVYHFAYAETLARTETSVYGAQHPSYDMQISGTGDVVLTDIREISASLVFDEQIAGRLSIRDSSDYLIAELTKVSQKPLELGLEPGLYRITLQRGDNFYRAEVFLAGGSRIPVAPGDFRLISAAPGTARGESSGGGQSSNGGTDTAWAGDIRREAEKYAPDEGGDRASKTGASGAEEHGVNIQLIPGKNILGAQKEVDKILFGLFSASGRNVQGAGTAFIGLTTTGYVQGVQTAGVFNSAGGSVEGAQTAGVFSAAGGSVDGVQTAGVFNMAGGSVDGVQTAGVFNTAGDSVDGIQASGIFNIARGGMEGIQAAGIFNTAGGDVEGVQTAGVLNMARGGVFGLQAGLINIAGEGTGEQAAFDGPAPAAVTVQAGLVNISRNENTVPLGFVNIVKNGIIHPSVYYDSFNFTNLGFRSGSKYFYTLLGFGTRRITTRDTLYVSRGGFGSELPLGKFFLNLDLTGGSVIDFESNTVSPFGELRLSGGYKLFEHLGVFAGLSYTYLHQRSDTSPNPDSAWLGYGWDNGADVHKIGVFAGLQF